MRALVLSNCPLERTQGSGYVILGYAEGLRVRGWEVDLLGPETIDPWPSLGRARSLRITFGMWRHATRALARRDYDVVEFYGGEGWLAISRLARRAGRRFLLVSHSNGLETACGEQLRRWLGSDTLDGRPRRPWQVDGARLARVGFRAADALVTVNRIERDYALAAEYRPPDRVLAIENPLASDFLGQPFVPKRPPRIVYCGSWIPRKGIAVLAADLSRVLAEFPRSRLRLIGVGRGFALDAHFPPALHERVEVLPFVADREQLRRAYADCAIAVMPSVYESFGLVAAEAMACGCALVATRTGFAATLEEGREARLLDAPRSPALYDSVCALLRD